MFESNESSAKSTIMVSRHEIQADGKYNGDTAKAVHESAVRICQTADARKEAHPFIFITIYRGY